MKNMTRAVSPSFTLFAPLFAPLIIVSALAMSACGSSTDAAPDTNVETTTATLETAAPSEAASSDAAPETALTGAVSDSAAIDGVWNVAAGSEAGYRVPEILNGQKTEGVGRTSGVTGSMTLAGSSATAAEFVFDMTKLLSDSGKRDDQVQSRIMRTAEFPTATFKLTSPVDFGAVPAEKEEVTAKASGDLTIHGVTKPVTVDLSARLDGGKVQILGSYEMTFADYEIEDPSFKPFVEVGAKGFIEWLLVLTK
jgi:polyisoprenoid-binding protein YceI